LGNGKDVQSSRLLTLLDVGKTPIHIALKPDGGEIFICNYDSSSISEAITNLNEVNHTFLIGKQPVRGLVSPDNALLYVTNFGSDSLAVYDIDRGRWTNSVDVGSHPEALALSPNQLRLLVINTGSGDLSVLELIGHKGKPRPEAPSLATIVPLGKNPRAIAVKAFVSQR
jgi:YVTN family beta-propeller protein